MTSQYPGGEVIKKCRDNNYSINRKVIFLYNQLFAIVLDIVETVMCSKKKRANFERVIFADYTKRKIFNH